jgi:competence protein ComEA
VRALLGEPMPAPEPQPAPAPARSVQAAGSWLPGPALDVGGSSRPSARPGAAVPLAPRWQLDRRAVTAVAVAVLVAGLITAWWVLSARPRHLAVQASPAGAVTSSMLSASAAGSVGVTATAAASSTAPPLLVVDVAGKVRSPGVYRLAPGSRVIDAVRAAGGVRRGVSTNALNLAAPLQDGEQVLVGAAGQPGAVGSGAVPGSGTAGAATSGPVDLNTATLEQLEALPGVGPVLAQRILDWRTQHGSFTSVEQLDEVSGIGPAKFAQLRGAVTV